MAEIKCGKCGRGSPEVVMALLNKGGVWECSECVKCWVCMKSVETHDLSLWRGHWMHSSCIKCRCGDEWLLSSSVVREDGGRRVCSFCNGCECGVEKCTFLRGFRDSDRHRLRAQDRGRKNPEHVLVAVGGKLLVDVHRPCGDCGEWCGRTDLVEMESPPAKKKCDKCGKCVHGNKEGLRPYYTWNGVGSYADVMKVEAVGHRECIACAVCGELAKDTPKTRDTWVEKDGVVTHAGCYKCEDAGCGKAIATQMITKGVYDGEEKYVHIKCWNAHKKKRKAEEKEGRDGGRKKRKVVV
jgi:hypothetical protein